MLVRTFVDGERTGERVLEDASPAWREHPGADGTPFTLFDDPFEPGQDCYYRLREFRLTASARPDERIASDAARLGFATSPDEPGGTRGTR